MDSPEQVPGPARRARVIKRTMVVATLAVVLGMSSAVFAVQRRAETAGRGPCGALDTQLRSPEASVRDVVRSFSLAFDVSVPEAVAPGNLYCFGRHREGEPGDVLGVAIEDASGDRVWIIRNEAADTFSAVEWERLFLDHGWASLSPTSYGWASDPSGQTASANLWEQLAEDRRQ